MKFINGFSDNAVLQRAKNNKCEQAFDGECRNAGDMYITVSKADKPLRELNCVKAGYASNGKFKGLLCGIPVGGPYNIQFFISDKSGEILEAAEVKNILVGDLWLLGGQSNMEGYGDTKHRLSPVKEVRAYYMDNKWNTAKDPIHNLWQAAAPVHGGKPGSKNPDPKKGVTGPGVSFGQEMFINLKVPQGLIACAHGGSSMTQWNPELKKDGDKSFYGAAINSLKRLGGKISGIIWYQGCSDANQNDASLYTARMKKLVNAFRKDAGNPSLPFVMVQIARLYHQNGMEEHWNSIRTQQYELPRKIKNLLTVSAMDLSLVDQIHLDGKSQNIVGKRLADAMLCFYDSKRLKPIEADKITILKERDLWGQSIIKVSFKNVHGSFVSDGRPYGFALEKNDMLYNYDAGGNWMNPAPANNSIGRAILSYKIEIKGKDIYIHTGVPADLLGLHVLYYGYGLAPVCNITDGAGRAMPAFKLPFNISPSINFTTVYVTEAEVSPPCYITESEENLAYPSKLGEINFIKARSNGAGLFHPEREKLATAQDKIFYFRTHINCRKTSKLKVLFSYDGPAKLYIDRNLVFTDMNGTNPMGEDKASIAHEFSAGEHEFFVVMASNKGAAWGIKLRFKLEDGKSFYDLPALMPLNKK